MYFSLRFYLFDSIHQNTQKNHNITPYFVGIHKICLFLGFITFWYNFIEYAITTHRRYTRIMTRTDKGALTLVDLQIAFFILFFGLFLAFLLLLIELIAHKRRKNQTFKYQFIN